MFVTLDITLWEKFVRYETVILPIIYKIRANVKFLGEQRRVIGNINPMKYVSCDSAP